MTLIIGTVDARRRVRMFADCAATDDDQAWTLSADEPKAWRAGRWLVGCAGSIAAMQALRRARFGTPASPRAVTTPYVADVVRGEIRRILTEAEIEHDSVDVFVAYPGAGLWVAHPWDCAMRIRRHGAIGNARDFAVGYLDAGGSPRDAIRAAAKRFPGVRGFREV